MTEQPKRATETDEVRDLRNVLIVGGIILLCLGPMILASGPIVSILQIPTLEITWVAIFAAVVTIAGLIALRMNWPTRRIAWFVLVAYTLFVALIVYLTGAPLTPMFVLYLPVVVAASFLIGRTGATAIAVLSVASYAVILILEYLGLWEIVDLWGINVALWAKEFEPRIHLASLFVINWSTVTIATLLTTQLTGVLARRLQTTNLQLRESELLRANMTDMLVHDLRNPLTVLIGGLEIVRLTMKDQMSQAQYSLLENARRSGHMMTDLVGELLDISKMEAGKLTLEPAPVDLCDLISRSVDSMRPWIEVEGLEVNLDLRAVGAIVPCDKQLISRVLANLISNAIKHTPSGGTITLQARQDKGNVIVSVTDTGRGIPPEYQERIFEKFSQVEELDRARSGTGLGLTFCKMTVEAHGGRIWVESSGVPGQGSAFFFTLPVDRP